MFVASLIIYPENCCFSVQYVQRRGNNLRIGGGGGQREDTGMDNVPGECRGPRAPYALREGREYARSPPENKFEKCEPSGALLVSVNKCCILHF